MTVLCERQRIGPGGSARGRGLFAAFHRRHDEGQLCRDQVLDHSDTVKAAIEQQELHADTQGDQAGQERADHVIHGLLGPHTTERQGITAASDHGIGGGVGEKVRGATLGFATADFVSMGCSHGAMVGQCDQIEGHMASTFAQALGDQARQQRIDVPFEPIKVAELAGQCAQHGGCRRSAFELVTGLMDREPSGSGKTKTCIRSRLRMAPGMLRGKVSRVLIVNLYTSWLFKVY